MDVLSHLVKGSMEMMASKTKITDLDEQCFHQILQYLPPYDLFLCRRVNQYFLKQIDSYLESCRHLTYDSDLNGIHIINGEFVFNGRVFDFIVSKMPNIRVMRFQRSPQMCLSLATTTHNIIRSLTQSLIMLNELHITRSRALDVPSLHLLVEWFPNLTHLTITLYNERSVEILTKGLANLKYFNLDESCLDDYGPHLQHFGLKIQTFIAAPDHNNHKNSIIEGLLKGNGRYLQELEMKIKVYDSDQSFFTRIGEEFELWSLKLILMSRKTFTNHCLHGLKSLSNLFELHLEENQIFNNFHTIFDDNSMLAIMRGCRQLESFKVMSGAKQPQIDGLNDHKSLSDDSLSLLDQLLPNITTLTLKSVHITDRTLDSIERLYRLKTLRLDSLPLITSERLQNLMVNAHQINRLEVVNCLNN